MVLEVVPLEQDVGFGCRVRGVTRELLNDGAVRKRINDLFEAQGLIVFEDVEPSGKMQLELSTVFGPLKGNPNPTIEQLNADDVPPGIVDMFHKPGLGKIVDINGQRLTSWAPWHFDHCYNNELNRAGVLRALIISPEGGETCFADGIQLYESLSPALRDQIKQHNIIYTLNLLYEEMRFGVPAGFRNIFTPEHTYKTVEFAKTLPRAIHPAVWTRDSGERVLHVSPWMAVGIEGHEDAAGDALLSAVCDEIAAKAQSYCHEWKETDMLVWDNWRVLHSVNGMDPKYLRRMHRTTIKGDYGLGYFENDGRGDAILEMTV